MKKELLRQEDEVRCVLNNRIRGRITSKVNYHGAWMYHIKPRTATAAKEFKKINPCNAPFLHWQLEKVLKGGGK